ncbi:MAG: PAS domain S-box protein [Balneolaceae bacterium]|nr:PAS domain S-box protein [Balneolaceae bacterium]
MLSRTKIIQLFEASSTPTSIIEYSGQEFTLIQVNDAFLSQIQYEKNDIIESAFFEIFPAGSKQKGSHPFKDSLQKVLATKKSHEISRLCSEVLFGKSEDKKRYFKIVNTPVLTENDEVDFIINSITDITKLVLNETEHKLILENTEDSFILVDTDLIIQNFNTLFAKNYSDIYGVEVKKGDSILDYAVSKKKEQLEQIYQRVLNGETIEASISAETDEGTKRSFSIKYKPAHDEESSLIGCFISLREITVEKKAQRSLKEKETRFRALVEQGGDVVVILDEDGNPKYITPSVKPVFGYTTEEAKKNNVREVTHPDDFGHVKKALKDAFRMPGKSIPTPPVRMKQADGSWRWFETSICDLRNEPSVGGIVDTIRDVHEQVLTEKMLAHSKEKYQSIIQTIDGIIWEADPDTFVFNYVSPQVQRILGYNPEIWIGTSEFWVQKIHPTDRSETVEYCKNQTKQGKNHTFEYRMQKANGDYTWIRDVVTVIKENGVPVSLNGLMIDINQEKKLEQKLKEVYKLAKIGTWELNLVEDKLYWSNVVKEMFEVDKDFEPELETTLNFYAEGENRDKITSAIENAIHTGEAYDIELKIISAKNKEKWIRNIGKAEFKNGSCIRLYGSTQDITKRKKAELKSIFERKNKEALINSTNDLVWSIDTNLKLITANDSFHRTVKEKVGVTLKPGNPITKGFEEYPKYKKKWEDYYKKALNGEHFRIEILEPAHIKTDPQWFETSFNPIYQENKITGVACFSRNITQAKKAEKDLKRAEEKYRNVVEHSTNMFYQHDTEGVLKYVSPQSIDFLGYTQEESLKKWTEFVTDHPVNKKGEEITQRAIDTGEIQKPFELQLKTGDGRIIWVEVNEAPLIKKEKVVGIVGSLTDITDRKQYEEKLKKSVERYDYVTKATSDAVWDWNLQTNKIYRGNGFENLFGYKKEDLETEKVSWHANIHPEDKDKIEKSVKKLLNSEQQRWHKEYRYQKSDGSYAIVEDQGFVIRNEKGKAIRMIGAIRDITEEKKIEIQNLIQQKVALFFKEENKLNQILEEVLQYLAEFGDFNIGEIWLTSIDQKHLNLASTFANDPKSKLFHESGSPVKRFAKGKGLPGKVWESEDIIIWNEINHWKSAARKTVAEKYDLNSAYGLPLFQNQHIVGVLILLSRTALDENQINIFLYEALEHFLGAEIKRKQQAEEMLLLFESAPDILAIASPNGHFTKVNPTFCEMMGYSEEELTSQPFKNFIHPDDIGDTMEEYNVTITGKRHANHFVNRYITKSGEHIWISWTSSDVFNEDGLVFAFGRNVTQQIKNEKAIKASLKEKETLLSEIHHRVKNNLAVVSGMMQLQVFESNNESLKPQLLDSISRIKTMATVHELLYQSNNFSQVEFSETMKKLINSIGSTLQEEPEIELDISCDSVYLNINQAIPASLIVNEVITNAYKHAFKEMDEGIIKFRLTENNDFINIEICDNGIGIPEQKLSPGKKISLGMHLIKLLSQQIDATYEYKERNKGTFFYLSFKKEEHVTGVGDHHFSKKTPAP